MLVELTIEANEESFVIVHQHGGNDVKCNPRIENVTQYNRNVNLPRHLCHVYTRHIYPRQINISIVLCHILLL